MNQTSLPLRQRIALLRRILPLALASLVVLNQLGLLRWVHDTFGHLVYDVTETMFYASVGPLVTYLALKLVDRWLAEKEAAERLAWASERRLASITSVSADAILSLDGDGFIQSWNHGAELLFGYAATDIHNRPLSTLLEPGAATDVELGWLNETVQQEGFVRGHETVCRDAGGRALTAELTATLLAGDDSRPPGMSIILRDITNRKRREEEIQRLNASLNEQVAARTRELAEKVAELVQANIALQNLDRTRSEFTSLVSHQIRAPLTNMTGAIQRMQSDCPAIGPTCHRMFAILNEQTTRLDRLVQDVLNAAQLEAGKLSLHPEPISILPVIDQAVAQTGARLTHRPLQLPVKPGLPFVYADRDRVVEVLVNLLDNADKYSPPGQDITLDTGADQTDVTISVRDYGPGLPPGDLERVFDKFYRADGSDAQAAYGYGLGLYVCRRLVEAQGGRIWAENHPGGGAVFSFALPVWSG